MYFKVASTPKKQATNSGSMTEYLLQLFDEYKIPKEIAAANNGDDEKNWEGYEYGIWDWKNCICRDCLHMSSDE